MVMLACITACAPHIRTSDAEYDVRTAAITLLLSRPEPVDTSRIVADSAEMYRRFADCSHTVPKPHCTLRDGRSVKMLTVQMIRTDSAVVRINAYVTLRNTCPAGVGPDFSVPIIGAISQERFSMVRRNGKWVPSGNGQMVVC